jgi:phosphoribosylformylglycinamidine synthase
VLTWQWGWLPDDLKKSLPSSPWLRMFQNARIWCEQF